MLHTYLFAHLCVVGSYHILTLPYETKQHTAPTYCLTETVPAHFPENRFFAYPPRLSRYLLLPRDTRVAGGAPLPPRLPREGGQAHSIDPHCAHL